MAIAYLNGSFLPLEDVQISPLDRGFLFADGIYEVISVYDGQLFRLAEHLARLENGLRFTRIEASGYAWEKILRELAQRNGGGDLALYLQVTRGAPPKRDHAFPSSTAPTVFAMANPLTPPAPATLESGLAATTLDDIRWRACHIKTIALLTNVLARQQALDRHCDDVILVRDGFVTETSAGNVFLVRNGVIVTPRKDYRILPGITRDVILELAAANRIPYQEQDIPLAQLANADEVWLSSTTKEVVPVTRIDGRAVGDGKPGPLWRQLWELFQAHKRSPSAAAA